MEMDPCSTLQVLRHENDGDKEACPLLRIFPEHIAETDKNILFVSARSCRLFLVSHVHPHSFQDLKCKTSGENNERDNYV